MSFQVAASGSEYAAESASEESEDDDDGNDDDGGDGDSAPIPRCACPNPLTHPLI